MYKKYYEINQDEIDSGVRDMLLLMEEEDYKSNSKEIYSISDLQQILEDDDLDKKDPRFEKTLSEEIRVGIEGLILYLKKKKKSDFIISN